MKIDILTLFPEMFSPLEHSIVGKAREKGLLDIQYHNFREYAEKARHVDDEPYGGGQGMLLRAQPIFDAFDAIEKKNPRVILLDPAGKQFDQAYACLLYTSTVGVWLTSVSHSKSSSDIV